MRRAASVPFLLAAAFVPGCDGASDADVRAALARADAAEANARSASALREKLEGRLAESERRTRAAEAAVEAARAEAAAAAERAKKVEKQRDALEAHRDEMKDWIEKQLLPVAERNDPRLVNLRDAATAMAEQVARLRGLPWKHDVMRRLVTREEVGEWMRRDLRKELPEEKAKEMVLVGAEMGICKPGTDIYGIFSQFMEAGAAAFYKPDTRTFYHIEGNDGRGAYPIVFHELVHALEDQHFDLDAVYKAIENDSDRALAVRGLVEGSASLFQGLYEKEFPADAAAMAQAQMKPELVAKQGKMLNEVPPFLIASMGLYPYQNGKEWCRRMGASDPAVVERLYRDPPVSTEQVLHPEKYALDGARDWPHVVAKPALGDLLGEGWKELESDTMGELMTGVLLTQLQNRGAYMTTMIGLMGPGGSYAPKGAAAKASAGWDGDRYACWVHTGTQQAVVVWSTVWDSDADAAEFASVYAPLLGRKVTGAKPEALPSPVRFTETATGRVSGLETVGRRVVIVLGAPAALAEGLLERGIASEVRPDPRDSGDTN